MQNSKRVEIVDLSKTFLVKDKVIEAVKNLSISVEAGTFACLLGPSGCGKTTLLRMLAGFEIPTSGKILVDNKDVSTLTPDKRDSAMVFQNYALFPHMNVFENIAYGLKVQKRPKEEIEKRVNDILHMMKMQDFATRVPSQMSGGQQQRVSLARALVMNSGLLLFDEPLSNLDAKLRIHMRDEIRKIQQQVGITSIYVTHDQAEAMALADIIVLMRDGQIEQIGTPLEIYHTPNSEYVAKFIGRANILQGTILELGTDRTKVKILGAEYFVSENLAPHKIGDTIDVVSRPEFVDYTTQTHKGRVSKSVFMGETHEYEVEVEGETLEVSLSQPKGQEIKKIGEVLHFGLCAHSLHVLKNSPDKSI